jgi:SAM-dependent methyltransferase
MPSEIEIQFVSTKYSDGVSKENEATKGGAVARLAGIHSCNSIDEYLASGNSVAPKEYETFISRWPGKKLKILDIGVGSGESSVFLATRGHDVFAVEPSADLCQTISAVAKKFSLPIHPICAVAEDLDKLKEREFDLVLFNSSLHHCDDPVHALINARNLLNDGGTIFLCAETQLKPWVSKERWRYQLETFPEKWGHYGGNEHAYHSWEYAKMLKQAGFTKIKRQPSAQFLDPVYRVEFDFKHYRHGGPQRLTRKTLLARVFYYCLMDRLARTPPLFSILASISLMPCQFSARK